MIRSSYVGFQTFSREKNWSSEMIIYKMIDPYTFCIFYSRRLNAETKILIRNLHLQLFKPENKTLNSDCIELKKNNTN